MPQHTTPNITAPANLLPNQLQEFRSAGMLYPYVTGAVSIGGLGWNVSGRDWTEWKRIERSKLWKQFFGNEPAPKVWQDPWNKRLLNAMLDSALGVGIDLSLNHFEVLRDRLAAAENGGRDLIQGIDNCNLTGGDYHLGYQQLSYINFYTYSKYLDAVLFPGQTSGYIENFIADVREALEKDIEIAKQRSQKAGKNPEFPSNFDSSNFPKVFDESAQDLYLALFILDRLRNREMTTLEDFIVNNPRGGWKVFTDLSQLNAKISKTDTYLDYMRFSDSSIPGNPSLSQVFRTPCTSSKLIADSVSHISDLWTAAPSTSVLRNIFEDVTAISEAFNKANMNGPLYNYKTWRLEAEMKIDSKDLTAIIEKEIKDKQSEPDFEFIKGDEKLFIWGEGAEETGFTYIGDIAFSIPPVAMRFGTTNQAMSIPTIRTKGDPVITTNSEMSRVDLTVYFSGENAINEQLRPLVAMYQTMPFSTVQNTTIFDSWVGRKNSFHTMSEYDLDEAHVRKRRFSPIPIYLENISLSTVPGFPNTIQAHLSLIKMNRFPYGVEAKMWKSWDIAEVVSVEKSLRYSLDNTILGSAHDSLDVDPINHPKNDATSTIDILDSVGKKHEISIGNSPLNYRPDDPEYTTLYPQQSEPFQVQYKNVLRDFPTHKGLKLKLSDKAQEFKQGLLDVGDGLEKYWPPYRPEHNDRLYLTYNTPRGFRTAQTAFKSRMTELAEVYDLMKIAVNSVEKMDTRDLKEIYKDPKKRPSLSKLFEAYLLSVNFVKELEFFQDSMNKSIKIYITDLISNEFFTPYMDGPMTSEGLITVKKLIDKDGNVVLKRFSVNLEDEIYVDEKLQIRSTTKDILDWIDKILEVEFDKVDEGVTVGGQTEPITNAFLYIIKPLFDRMSSNPLALFGIEEIETILNYDKVHVELSWQNNPQIPLDSDIYDNFNAKTADEKRELEALKEAISIDTLVEQGEHYAKPPTFPYRYRFQSVLQSITYNYANNVIPLYLSSSSTPTFQHMGIPNPTVTLTFRTRDERLHKVLTDMKEAVQEVGTMIMAGHSSLIGMDKLSISGNHTGENGGVFSGHLLNSLGFSQCVIQNASSRSLEGYPGWWEVSLDLIGDTQNLRLIEQLKPLSIPELTDLPYVIQHFFPTALVNINIDSSLLFDQKLLDIHNRYLEAEKKHQLIIANPAPMQPGGPKGVVVSAAAGSYVALGAISRELDDALEAALQSVFGNINSVTIYLHKEANGSYIANINAGGNEKIKKAVDSIINYGTNSPVDIILDNLTALSQWEQSKRMAAPGEGFDVDFPEQYSISNALAIHYQEYLKSIIDIIHSLVQRSTKSFLSKEQGGISYPIVGLPFDPTDDTMHLEFMILSNKIRTSFYGLLRRQDFREFLDYYIQTTEINPIHTLDKFIEMLELVLGDAVGPGGELVVYDADKGEYYYLEDRTSYQIRKYVPKPTNFIYPTTDYEKNYYKKLSTLLAKYKQYKVDEVVADRPINITNAYADLIKKVNESVTETYPDLRLPNDVDPHTGHRYSSPGFPFVDQDPDLEIIEMNKAAEQLKAIVFAQFAALSSGKFVESYTGLKSLFIGADGSEDAEAKMAVQKALYKTLTDSDVTGIMPISTDQRKTCSDSNYVTQTDCENEGFIWEQKLDKFIDIGRMIEDLVNIGDTFKRISSDPRNDAQREPGHYYWKDSGGNIHESDFVQNIGWVEDENADPPLREPPDHVKVLTLDQVQRAQLEPLGQEAQLQISKINLMRLMSRAAMLDYLVTMVYAASIQDTLDSNNVVTSKTFETSATMTYNKFAEYNIDTTKYAEVLGSALNLDKALLSAVTDEGHEIGLQIASALLQKRTLAINMAKMTSEDNPDAFLHYFGIGSIDHPELKWEMLNKFNNYLQTKRKGTMDRAFPTFKIFFIEEDNYVWKAFDDFYTYDAASEISIVENKHAASKTAVLRLSNVTNALTNDIYEGINESLSPTPGHALSLRAGTQIMILLGYGSDYRQLRMKFKGAITEINPGSILEVTAQSWGAGLLNNVGAVGGVKYSATTGATTLGAAVIDILSQTPGLRQLGRWQMRDSLLNDPSKVSETSLKNVYWAKVMTGFFAPLQDFNPIQSNFIDIIKGLPKDQRQLQEAYRRNNVIVKSFGNSLYDNIIINDTRAHGYGFSNWFHRLWDEGSSMFTDPKTAGFNWYVVRQTAWDSLHEIALFLGDYIVTTLPFNEGKDIFLEPPRETLYFGPREGQYQASQTLPKTNIRDIIEEILKKIERPAPFSRMGGGANRKAYEEASDKVQADTNYVIKLGKTMLSESLNTAWGYGSPGGNLSLGKRGFTSDSIEAMWSDGTTGTSGATILPIFVRTLEAHGWNRVADLIKKSVIHVEFDSHLHINKNYLINIGGQDTDIPKTALHEIILNDFEGQYLNIYSKSGKYAYTTEDMIILNAMRGVSAATNNGTNLILRDKEAVMYKYIYPTAGKHATIKSWTHKVANTTNQYTALYNLGWGTASPFEDRFNDQNKNAVFHHILFNNSKYWGPQYGGGRGMHKVYMDYLENIDFAIAADTYSLLQNYSTRKKAGLTEAATGININLETAINSLNGDINIFQYKPTIGNHVVNSYEDIIDNSIIATADQMYNHVEVLYDSEPDPTKDGSRAEYRAQAWISYDQDPDYLRTYQTYMKNLDPNLFFNMFEANSYISNINSEQGQASMLTQHSIAQQVLMNVMRPMYQGTLTLLGNPHIKPWDQVFIHDDSLGMYGPVEVEQVVNTLSATGGYTTTIIPNLCVSYKSASKQIDDLVLSLHSTIQAMGLVGTILKHAATIGAIWFAMRPKMFHPFKGDVGGKLGTWLSAGVVNITDVTADVTAVKTSKDVNRLKTVAKKHLTTEDYKIVSDVADEYAELETKVKVQAKNVKAKVLPDLPGPGETGGVKGGKNKHSIFNRTFDRANFGGSEAWNARGENYKKLATGKNATKSDVNNYKKWQKTNKSMRSTYNLKGTTISPSRARVQATLTKYATTVENTLKKEGLLTTGRKNKIDAALKVIRRKNSTGKVLNSTMNSLIRMQALGAKETTRAIVGTTLDKQVASLTMRSSMMSGALRVLNWVGWAWTVYEVGATFWESYTAYATGRIFLAGLLAGENQLTWLPLEYQGKDYVAGLEGIVGTPRGIDTILWGEFNGDNNQHNRLLSVLERTLQGDVRR